MEKEGSLKIILLSLLGVIVLGLVIAGVYFYFLFKTDELIEEKGILLTKEELPNYLSRHQLIEKLPNDSKIELKVGEDEYLISQGQVEKIDPSLEEIQTDISVEIPEESVARIGEVGLCQAIGELAQSGEVSIETAMSETDLLLKYKNLLKYRDCVTG